MSFGFFEADQTTAEPVSSPGETEFTEEVELTNDCYRFDVHSLKLERYKKKSYKKLLKKKFITGIAKDKIMQNILNMDDSDEEGKDKQGNAVDKQQAEQLRKMEENSRKGTKEDKKRKRMMNKGIKVDTDSDAASDDVPDGDVSGEEEKEGVKKKEDKKPKEHKPIKKTDEQIKKS